MNVKVITFTLPAALRVTGKSSTSSIHNILGLAASRALLRLTTHGVRSLWTLGDYYLRVWDINGNPIQQCHFGGLRDVVSSLVSNKI